MVRDHFYQRYKDAREALEELNRVFSLENCASKPPLVTSISTVIPPSNPSPGSSTIISRELVPDPTPSNLPPGSSTIISPSIPDVTLEPKKIGEKWGYVDENGKVVIAPKFYDAQNFSEGLAGVQINPKWGYMAKTGQRVKIISKWGYIDKTGQFVIPPQFYDALPFRNGRAEVKIKTWFGFKEKWRTIDKTEKFID